MSRHSFRTQHDSQNVDVILGWDRPLQEFFLQVRAPDSVDEETMGFLYSDLDDPHARCRDLSYFSSVLTGLGIAVPAQMLTAVSEDSRVNRGNFVVEHEQDGTCRVLYDDPIKP